MAATHDAAKALKTKNILCMFKLVRTGQRETFNEIILMTGVDAVLAMVDTRMDFFLLLYHRERDTPLLYKFRSWVDSLNRVAT